jgi:hypothetical protein
MSELGDLEAAVVGLLESVTIEGESAFADVTGLSDPDGKRAAAALARLPQPAAAVAYDGRTRADVKESWIGIPRLVVFISNRHLGDSSAARLGDAETPGGFDLLGVVTEALDGVVVLSDHRLQAFDEQTVTADDRTVVYAQRYLIERLASTSAPTFGGQAVAGPDSIVSVELGETDRERVTFGFPGIDGVYRHDLGNRGRSIRWSGQLRADDDTSLNAIESAIENLAAEGESQTLVDSWGRSHPDCVLDSFQRNGPRRRHPVTGQAAQNFELIFRQLRTGN